MSSSYSSIDQLRVPRHVPASCPTPLTRTLVFAVRHRRFENFLVHTVRRPPVVRTSASVHLVLLCPRAMESMLPLFDGRFGGRSSVAGGRRGTSPGRRAADPTDEAEPLDEQRTVSNGRWKHQA